MYSFDLDKEAQAPLLTEDDAFNSNPMNGHIAYRLPTPGQLFGVSDGLFERYDSMKFRIKVRVPSKLVAGTVDLECVTLSRCELTYKRVYTPSFYGLNPPVVFKGLAVQIYFNQLATMSIINNLPSDDLPIVNVKIGGSIVDFDGFLDSTATFPEYTKSSVRGRVTDQPISQSQNVSMLWETGLAWKQGALNKHCNIDMTSCYEAKTVPVIFSVSAT